MSKFLPKKGAKVLQKHASLNSFSKQDKNKLCILSVTLFSLNPPDFNYLPGGIQRIHWRERPSSTTPVSCARFIFPCITFPGLAGFTWISLPPLCSVCFERCLVWGCFSQPQFLLCLWPEMHLDSGLVSKKSPWPGVSPVQMHVCLRVRVTTTTLGYCNLDKKQAFSLAWFPNTLS